MTFRRAAVALLALLLSGCALLQAPPVAGPVNAAASSAAARADSKPSGSVRIEVSAPDPLKALLERHLDLVRLGRMTSDDVDIDEWQRLIDATPSQVRELLRTEGYFEPQISVQRVPSRNPGEADLVKLNVIAGPRIRVGRVTFDAEGEIERGAAAGEAYASSALAQLRARWDLPEGAPFRNASWSDAKANALARLRAAGYAAATWTGTGAQVDVAAQTVRLFLVADSGPLFRLGEIRIEGLVQHQAETVRNLAASRAGAPVTEVLLLDFQDRLQKAGLFESVTVTLDPDPANAARAEVAVRLREAPVQVYTFGVGISANTGPRASVEHLYRRVFGWAATAHNKVEWGNKRQAWEGDVTAHPGPGLYRNFIGGAVENLQTDTDTVLSQRLRLGRTQDTQRLERLFFAEVERSTRTPLGGNANLALALSGNFHGGWRDLDSVVLPTKGATLALQMGLGHSSGTDAKNAFFGRAYGRLTGYLPLGSTWYGQARIELGQVFLPAGAVVPESRLFRAGGDESVRGYTFKSLGPVVDGAVGGGKALLTTSMELARPVSAALPAVWGAVFLDAGNAAASFGTWKPAYGAGVGVRWRSPVGPLRLDWAWGNETRQGRLHFSVGIAF